MSEQSQNQIEYVITPPSRFSLDIKEIWEYRELFYVFTQRLIKIKYKQAALGFMWAILQPLAFMTIATLVFGRALKVNTGAIPYPIFVFSGLLIWNLFSTGFTSAANSMVSNAGIIRKIYFPRLIIPISSILAAFFDFLMAFLVLIPILIYYQHPVNIGRLLIFLPLSLILTLLTTFGAGTLLAGITVKYRDFQYVIPFLVQFLMYINPIMYPVTVFDDYPVAKALLSLNPMTAAINMSRFAFIDQPINWTEVGLGAIGCLILIGVGIYAFKKMEAFFADFA